MEQADVSDQDVRQDPLGDVQEFLKGEIEQW